MLTPVCNADFWQRWASFETSPLLFSEQRVLNRRDYRDRWSRDGRRRKERESERR